MKATKPSQLPKNWKNINAIDIYDCDNILQVEQPETRKKAYKGVKCNAKIGNTDIKQKGVAYATVYCDKMARRNYSGSDESKKQFYREQSVYSYEGIRESDGCPVVMKVGEKPPLAFVSKKIYMRKQN